MENTAPPDSTGAQPAPPQEVPDGMKVDVGYPNVDAATQEEGPKINMPPIHLLPNLADAQFDSPQEVPMPPCLMDFTQEHWDTMVMYLTVSKH